MVSKFVTLLLLLLLPAKSAYATTLTVSPGQSIQSSANSANPGDTISVSAGIYNETVTVSRPGIIFQANGVVTVKGFTITGNNTTVTGFRVDDTPSSGIDVHADNSVIKNNIITRGRNAGMFISGKNNLIENNDISNIIQPKPHSSGGDANCVSFFGSGHVFRGNYCHDIYRNDTTVTDAHIDAFQTWFWDREGGSAHDIVFENNVLIYPHGGTSKGFIMTGGAYNIIIKNNVIYSKTGVSFVGGYNVTLLNNTFVGTGRGSYALHLNDVRVNVNNNIFAHHNQRVIELIGSTNTLIASNNCYADYGIMLPANTGDIRTLDAKFVNEATRNFRLQSTSPCINMGYEYGSSTPASSKASLPAQAGDLNTDGVVNLLDFNLLISKFGNPYTLLDFNAIISHYGR